MTAVNIDLGDKVAIVTGAASGIGRATARLLAGAGARVLACDLDSGVEAVAEEIAADGHAARAMVMDAGLEDDVRRAVAAAVEEWGGLDIFHANAGVTGDVRDIASSTPEIWAEVLRVNLIGPFLAVKHAGPEIARRGGGSILMTASVAGMRFNQDPPQYSASKAGLMNLVQQAAQEYAGTGVRVNAVAPGLIETGMTQYYYDYLRETGAEDTLGRVNPEKRGGTPSEVAAAVLFLVSDLASYINGQALPVDGGLSSSHPVGQGPAPKEMQEALSRREREGDG